MTLRLSRKAARALGIAEQPLGSAHRAPAGRKGRKQGNVTNPITIFVPALPPTVNHMYIALRGGGKALSEEAETFRKLVLADVLHAPVRPEVPDGPLALTMRLMFSNNRRQDIDNRIKAGLDAIALALRFDDCRIARITIERVGVDRGRPWCELIIEAYQPTDAALAAIGAVVE